jgi:colicin import membrane protein
MKRSVIISSIAHVIVLGWGLVAFAARPSDAPPVEALPVEFISANQLSQLTHGVKNAPKALENPKPLVDKIGEPKPVKELAPKVADKPEIRTDSAAAAAPPKEPKPEPKPEVKPEPRPAEKVEKPKEPEPKPTEKAEKPKDPKPKPDQITDELKKDEPKKPPKKPPEFKPDQIAEELRKDDTRKPRTQTKFDANQVAALLDHREPQRQVATGATLSNVASLGAPNGNAAHLSQSELEALRAKLISLWNPPPAISSTPDQYVVTIRIRLTRDHRLIGPPEVLNGGSGPLFEATRDSAVRAVIQGQPYDMLSATTYDLWKEMDINFDPREVFGG